MSRRPAIIVVLFFVCATAVPSLISGHKYHKENLKIFDDTYSVGLWDVKFDEDLYLYQGFGSSECFANRSCSNLMCEPCDWTDPLICSGQLRGVNTTCPCSGSPFLCYPNQWVFERSVWPRGETWTMAEIESGIIDIAYHPSPPNNCSCIIYKVDVLDGKIEGMLVYYGELWTNSDGIFILSRHGTATICPSDPRWGQTNLVRVFSATGVPYAKIKLSIEYKDVPGKPITSPCVLPSHLENTHQCIQANVFTTLAPHVNSSYIRAVIDPPERCGIVGFWASSNVHLLSTDPWISPENSTQAFRSHRENAYDGRPWPSIYPYCLQPHQQLYVFVLGNDPVSFMVDTAKNWMILRPITDFAPPDFYKRALGSVTVQCSNHNYTAHSTAYTVAETMETGSANLRMIFPSDDADVFYPPPFFGNNPYKALNKIMTQNSDPKRIIVSLLLSQRLSTREQPLVWGHPWFQNSYQWLSVDEWKSCVLHINGVVDYLGTPLRVEINDDKINTGQPLNCKKNAYMELSRNIGELQDSISISVSENAPLADLYRLQFLQDRMMATNDFYSCKSVSQLFYTTSPLPSKKILTKECLFAFNDSAFDDDPCCKLGEHLYDKCSLSEKIVPNQHKIESFTNLIDQCSIVECAQRSHTNLLLQLNSEFDPTTCTNSLNRPDDANVYWRCLHKIWGPEPVTFPGPNCNHDSDCFNSTCNVRSKRCVVNIKIAEVDFISCVYDEVTTFARTFISNELGVNSSDNNIKSQWLDSFTEILPCSDFSTPVGFDLQFVSYGRCYGCDGYFPNTTTYQSNWAFSPGNSFPSYGFSCWAPGSSSCSITVSSYSAKSFCGVLGCNHLPHDKSGFFPFVVDPSYCPSDLFCGITDDGFFYDDITSVIPLENCHNITLCVLANGTKIKTSTEEDCVKILSCDAGNQRTESECLNAGSCSDATDYDVGIWSRLFDKETEGCFFKIRYLKPFNPTIEVCEPPFRNTILGCSLYPGQIYPGLQPQEINASSCESGNFRWGDPSIFELINPRWITRARNQVECSNYGNVCDDPQHPRTAGVNTYTNTLSFKDDCAKPRQLFTWTAGRWLPGQPRRVQRILGNLTTRFSQTPRQGLNLPRILSNLTSAANKLQSLKIQSSAFCKTSYKRLLDEIVCSCKNNNLSTYDDVCYPENTNITTIAVACDEESVITSGDFQMILTATSLPFAVCDNLMFTTSSIVTYQSRTITPMRTLLVNYNEDTEYALRNRQLGIYGKLLTNGYSATFKTEITNVVICIKLSSLRAEIIDYSKYPIIDIASREWGSLPDDAIPHQLNVTVNGSNFCVNISRMQSNRIYYFIQRMDQDYETVERTVFTSREIAYISVLLALYCFGEIAILWKSSYLAYVMYRTRHVEYMPGRLIWVLFLMGCFFAFRIALFSLLLNKGLLGSSSARAINYVLFEFPILLFFAFVTNYVCTWFTAITFIKKSTNDHKRRSKITNYASLLFNVVIFILFIVMIILFQTLIFDPHLICGGSIFLYDESTSYALLLSYRIIFSTISALLGIGIFFTAMTFAQLLSDPDYGLALIVRMRLYALSIAGGVGMIGQAIYFLVITITKKTPENFTSLTILLVLEVIPALMFVFVESITDPERINSGNSTRYPQNTKNSSATPD